MKKLFKNLPLALLAMTLAVGCGKGDSSGSSSSPGNNIIGNDGFANVGQSQNLNELRNQFKRKSMADGLADGNEIYHIGEYFGGVTSDSGSIFNLDYCLSIGPWSYGCEDNTSEAQMLSYINQGRSLRVSSRSTDSLNVKKAVDVNNGLFVYENQTLSKSSSMYQEMLSGEEGAAIVRSARIYLVNNQNPVSATYIKNYEGEFVVTTNIPVAANPVFANTYSGGMGALSHYGNVAVRKVEVQVQGYNGQAFWSTVVNFQR